MPHADLSVDSLEDRRRRILAAAVAAPSSHNTQPWRFHVSPDTIEVWGDASRMLPRSDRDHRQFFLSLGCAIQNILVAALEEGFQASADILPDPQQELLAARISIKDSGKAASEGQPLSSAIQQRTANREAYEEKSVPAEFLDMLRGLSSSDTQIFVIEDKAQMQAIAKIVADATETAFRDKDFTEELSHWIKPSLARYRDGMPGYNIGVPWPISFIVPLAIRHGNVVKQQRQMVETALRGAPAYFLIATREDRPSEWINSGMLLEGAWLQATAAGMAMGPLAAAVQIGEHFKELQAALGTSFRPQVFARLGYASKKLPKSPRRDLETFMF